ncbi:hypothetical protein F511_24518 [Dorcoceras hygrometricum]|uniref:Splicing factor 3B subunit 1-like n=1 Tax=Dorcoceras hygrometricum TaxID=472368 RepID=A0A2Z7D440_9LAMI|nr:hypothetical protein F511_24518 [Dorcoceras hygrometricum]
MAAALINNAIQIYFDFVFGMADAGMVQMFKALESSGPGKSIEISEDLFAGTFELPTERLTDMHYVPKDLVFDARSAFSTDGQQLKTSCKKREMKFEFRLLNDILAKTVTVKAGSLDVVTHERFLMMSAIYGGVKVNWGRLLFNIFKDMVTPASKQARRFAVQICILLKGAPDLELGESKDFPPLKILTTKTVGTYVSKNKNITVEEVVDEPVEKVVKKKSVTKKRPAPTADEPVSKKKRTTVGRDDPAKKNLSMVTMAQDVEPISVVPAATPKSHAAHRRGNWCCEVSLMMKLLIILLSSYDEDNSLKVLSNEEEPLVETEKEKEKEEEKEKMTDSTDTEPLSKVLAFTETLKSDEESMSIDALLAQIPKDMMLPSITATEPTKIKFVKGIEIKERDCLRRLAIVESVSDIAAKEEQMLQWAETYSLQTAVQRRLYIVANSSSSQSENLSSSISSSSSDSRMLFTADDLPKISSTADIPQIEETTAAIPQISISADVVSSIDYTEMITVFGQETQTGIATLSTQLSEIVAYLNRDRDDKKGEVSSSRGPQPPPDDRNKPGSGDGGRGKGSCSEPSRKRGSGCRGGGSTSSRGFIYWLGE